MSNNTQSSILSPRPKSGKRPQDETQWSFGWDKQPSSNENPSVLKESSIMKYHNQSNILLEDKYKAEYDNKKVQMRKNRTDEINAKMPTFNPKTANQTHIVFGSEKGDFRPQSSGMMSPRVPPGGKSTITFG